MLDRTLELSPFKRCSLGGGGIFFSLRMDTPSEASPSRRKAWVHVTPFFLCKKTSFPGQSQFPGNGLVQVGILSGISLFGQKKVGAIAKTETGAKTALNRTADSVTQGS
jgi:hypothetical protein